MENVLSSMENGGGPSFGLGMVTYATEDIWDYTVYTLAINQIYAEQNGYIMRHMDPGTSNYEPFDARWNKVKILEMAIDPITGWARDLTYVMWLDADLVVLDMGMRMEQIVADYPKAHIFLSAEHAGSSTLMNSGAVIVRNSAWSRKFLREWWDYGARNLYSDQEQFDLLYKKHLKDWNLEKFVIVLPPDAINSDPPAMTQQKPFNQVLHLMGEHTPFRVKVFSSGLRELCRHISTTTGKTLATAAAMRKNNIKTFPLLPQLNLTRDNMLKWTIEEYSIESKKMLEDYKLGAKKGQFGIKESRRVANSVHHFAHALTFRQGPGDANTAVNARKKVYALLVVNMENRRKINNAHLKEHGRVLEDWPELLKIVAEAGQNLVGITSTSNAERKRVAEEVQEIMEEMLNTCHPDQRRAVMHMVAHMHSEKALISLNEKDNEGALESFQTCLEINRDLAKLSGEHVLISPMTAVANMLSTLHRFDEAYPLYDDAIKKAEKYLGPEHESLSQHTLNLGIALVHGGRYEEAEPYLLRSLQLSKQNSIPDKEMIPTRARDHLEMARKRTGKVIRGIASGSVSSSGGEKKKKKATNKKKRTAWQEEEL